ncbi:LysM domain-containing protein [Desulfacinum infernum DSM 9756]|uniref:LysM domain-containing protein n=1 Tax=Desulfacinum infernum DSM 9756 TaxID=1121391 RepID=A0A1M4Z200_9BACT|nr:penicillin-insensitive murein endopeptidase [Desulfacinum infernum]SHF11596.1 LysM domain-containing protein [Desulfacinum infernum DSM 9756]
MVRRAPKRRARRRKGNLDPSKGSGPLILPTEKACRHLEPPRFRAYPARWGSHAAVVVWVFILSFSMVGQSSALTRAIGEPFRGRLEGGVPFPTDLGGYRLRCPENACATPELIGGVLDAIEKVRTQFPDTVNVLIGDISRPGGGWLRGHRSHQNGRDIDIGMYAKGNRPLDRLTPMNAYNLDVAKTWALVDALLQTGRVEYIFVDRKIQRLLHRYALDHGWDEAYLDRLFYNVGRAYKDGIIRHARRHRDHLHVRFYAPWSTLAGKIRHLDPDRAALIELAQNAFLPKTVHYYVDGSEPGLKALARSFGVRLDDLLRWNNLTATSPLTPGMQLVYYRRAFELEPVHIASTLQPRSVLEQKPLQLASIDHRRLVEPPPTSSRAMRAKLYRVRPGDSLWSIAKRHGLSLKELCRLNRLDSRKPLRPGQRLTVGYEIEGLAGAPSTTHTVAPGENLWGISRKYGVPLKALCRANGLSTRSILRPGQKLSVPAFTSR